VRKSYPYVLALALISSGAIYGSAQTTYSGRPAANAFFDDQNRGWEEGRRRAQEAGHEDGFNDGRADFNSHHSYRPTNGRNYKHGDRGYDGRFGDRNRYRDEYRQAYAQGYHEGYYEREHGREHRGDQDHH
jgi:hypothetical protein